MLVSIIIPYFNDPINIRSCIDSVLNQTYKNFEIIIIDDENTLNSKKILKKLSKKNKKIKIFFTKKNLGVSYSRNLGIKNSRGKFIAFLDSDDLWKKNKLKFQLDEIKKRKLDVCYTNYHAINQNEKVLYEVTAPKKLKYFDLLRQCPICCSSVVLKKSILKKNKFRLIKTKEDYELWLRLSKKNFLFGGINKYFTIYRVRKNTLSSKHFNKLYNAFKIYNHYNKFNPIFSFYCICRLYFNAFIKKFVN